VYTETNRGVPLTRELVAMLLEATEELDRWTEV
jgi:hypothetical protein